MKSFSKNIIYFISSNIFYTPPTTCQEYFEYIERRTKNKRKNKEMDIVDAIFEAYNSLASDKTDNYNSSFYYDAL